jgi:gluconolactonase
MLRVRRLQNLLAVVFISNLLSACSGGSGGIKGGAGEEAGTAATGGAAGSVGSAGAPGTNGAGGAAAGSGGSSGATGTAGAAGSAGEPEGGTTADGPSEQPSGGRAPRLTCPPGPFPAPVAGASQVVCANFNFKYNWNEGPTWIAGEKAFFFSHFVIHAAGPGDIIKYTPGGDCETWVAGAGCNGLTANINGNLVGACQTPRAVVEYDINTRQPKVLASMYNGQMLDSPNDIVTHSNGTIYFTNPTFELGGRPQGVGPAIFRIDPMGTLILIVKGGGQPNGITLSADEKRLYAVGGGVWDVDVSGVPSNQRGGFPLNADGISTDCAGNIYLSGGQIISPDGKQIGTFPGGTMATFGGEDGKTLIVVFGAKGVRLVQMNIPGPAH